MWGFTLCPSQGMPGFLSTIPATPRILSLARTYAQKCWKQYDHFVVEVRSLTASNIYSSYADIWVNFPPDQIPESVASKKLWIFLKHNTSLTVYMWQYELSSSVCLANKDLIKSPLKSVGRILLLLHQALNCSHIVIKYNAYIKCFL